MHKRNKLFLLTLFSMMIFSSYVNAACTPSGTQGDDNVTCSGTVNGWQHFDGGSDKVELNAASGSGIYWLDKAKSGNVATDGNDIFIAHDSSFFWVFGFNGDDRMEIYHSTFSNLYADTNPYWVGQRGNDTIIIENSVSNGWILGGNDNDMIRIKDSNVSFVAAGYSDIYGFDYTPYDGNDTIILDNVDFGKPNYAYTNRPGAVEGGKNDDLIVFKNGGSAYGVTGGHGNDQIIVEDDMLFNACTFKNDRNNSVECGIYGDEPYASEANTSTFALHGNDEIIVYAGDLSGIVVDGGHGSDLVEIHTPVILLDTNLSGGDDRSIADSFIDTLVFDAWTGDLNGSQLQNWENVVLSNVTEITFLDDKVLVGYEAGVGIFLEDNSILKITHDLTIDGNLDNNAKIDMQADGNLPASVLTITNKYSGNSGIIVLDTKLNDASSSISDKIVIKGDTSGTTYLRIVNTDGLGGQTPTGANEGILLVEVRGNSDANAFALLSPLRVGEYTYRLVQGSNGNWYLQSSLALRAPGPSADMIVAEPSRLKIDGYRTYTSRLPVPGAATTCQGPFEYILQENPKSGTLTLDQNTGSYTYTPESNFEGSDRFTYKITSPSCAKDSNIAQVSIDVECASSQISDSADALGMLGMFLMTLLMGIFGLYTLRSSEFSGV